MKNAFGKLSAFAFALMILMLFFAPMRSGVEDTLKAGMDQVTLEPGQSLTVGYELYAETAQTVVYSSDNPDVATVDQTGRITAVLPGKTRVHMVAQGGARASTEVEVRGVAVQSFALNTNLLEIDKGNVSGLSCVFNAGASDALVTWSSENPSIATVDAAGRVKGISGGETRVTATTSSGFTASATVRVRVKGNAIRIAPEGLVVGVGASISLTTSYLPSDTTDTVVGWSSSRPDVLSVDEKGRIRALSPGTAEIAVTTVDGLIGYTQVTVESASKGFQLNPTSIVMERGSSAALSAWLIDDGGAHDANHHVEWSSSNPSVADVDDGTVTALQSGSARITAICDGFRASCTVRVETNVQNVNLNMTQMYLLKEQTGEPFQLKATVEPADADDTSVMFATDNPLVANVSADGLVTLTGGYGTAVITATAGCGAQASFIVSVVTQLPDAQ